MFGYPLKIETVSPRHLWLRDPSGELVAVAEAGTLRDPGTVRVRRSRDGRPADELLRVVDAAEGSSPGGAADAGERRAAENLRRWYGGPGVPAPGARRPDYRVLDPDSGPIGLLRVESSWRGTWRIADASGTALGRLVRQGVLFREGNVEFAGSVVLRLRRRSLLFGGMELEGSGLSGDAEKLALACVVTMLLAGSSGAG